MDLSTYLDQLEREAKFAGIDLAKACEQAGIAKTTLQRWRRGEVFPREATAKTVLAKIRELALASPADSGAQR